MNSLANPVTSIKDRLNSAAFLRCRVLWSATDCVAIGDLLRGSSLSCDLRELSGRSVLLVTRDQLAAALALIELDGVVSRIVICPPETSLTQLLSLAQKAGIDTIISDYDLPQHASLTSLARVTCGSEILPAETAHVEHRATEWVLITSGTTGAPKMIAHDLKSLIAPIESAPRPWTRIVWGTFYDIRRYGGLQILLRVVIGGGSLVLSDASETISEHLIRLGEHAVTHLSGTPSHWRRTLMSPAAHRIAPAYIRVSGEIADQAILNTLHSFYPKAAIAHVFASTEAGVAFEIGDGLAGFPSAILESNIGVKIKISNGSLQIRSNRVASRYLNEECGVLVDDEGFVDTGDMVELHGDRYHFLGRRNGVINVGGLKVYPEEVEAVINRHPAVRMSVVRPRRNSITGSLVCADVMLKEMPKPEERNGRIAAIKTEILDICRQNLPPYKVPATLRYVPSLELAMTGKLVRHHA